MLSLHGLTIPPTVKLIKCDAFSDCSGLSIKSHNAICDIQEYFVYYGREYVPRHVTHFTDQFPRDMIRLLWSRICPEARDSLHRPIPKGHDSRQGPSVKSIKLGAFNHCKQLVIVILNDELKEIGQWAIYNCTSLHEIVVPPFVKSIKMRAFYECSGLTAVTLHDGLEEMGGRHLPGAVRSQASSYPPQSR